MRVSTSRDYCKELLIFGISKYRARLEVNVQNLFSFLPSPPFLPFCFPTFYFQVCVAIGGHVVPRALKASLD